MIDCVIFDMDGVIVDSEPFWRIAEKEVFKTVGLNLTTEMCHQTTGLDELTVAKYWYDYQPWTNKTPEQVAREIEEKVIELVLESGQAREGIDEVLAFFRNRNIPVAVASSAKMKIIEAVLEKLKLKDKFAAVYSSEFVEYGKPHPDVYIETAKKLGKQPVNCLVFEDSFYGALAAKAALMKVVAVLEDNDINNTRFDFTDMKISLFKQFGIDEFEFLNTNNR